MAFPNGFGYVLDFSDRTMAESFEDKFSSERTLEELVADIERTLAANKPEVALDHLHTCGTLHSLKMRKFKNSFGLCLSRLFLLQTN